MNKIFEQLVESRGISEAFLSPKYEKLTAPEELPDMKKAVSRIKKAKQRNEKVLIYGDYDVDGVTSTAIMAEVLGLVGLDDVQTMLPDRFIDGYGMSKRLVEQAKKDGVKLIITVDCGSNNAEIIDELNQAGIDVIVTDHHELSGKMPDAAAVVNPKREDFRLGFDKRPELRGLQELSGAGVAFMVAKALTNVGLIPAGQEKWLLDLAMIGIICDSMALTGDNRIICKFGMIVLEKTRRAGLKELMRIAGVKRVSSEAIGFQIGPRLNAAGRMETAELSLKLLLTKSRVEAAKIAAELERLNLERRAQQNEAVKEVEGTDAKDDPVIVAMGKWHEGIVGIIAGRLTEKYKKPSFVLSEMTGEVLKGSGRSFGEFNLALALRECQDLLEGGGGHAAACGLSVKRENFECFKTKICDYYNSLDLKNQERFLEKKEDLSLDLLDGLDLELMDEMGRLEPFGEGNDEPVFLLRDMLVLDVTKMGNEGQHLRLLVRDKNGKTMKLVAFSAPKMWLNLRPSARINIWMNLTDNEWNGLRSVEGRILKILYA